MTTTDFEQSTIEIASWNNDLMVEVTAWVSQSRPHLAISESPNISDRLTITHTPSGYAVFYGDDNLDAMKLLFERIYDKVDWALPTDDIAATLQKNIGGKKNIGGSDSPFWQLTRWYDQIKFELLKEAPAETEWTPDVRNCVEHVFPEDNFSSKQCSRKRGKGRDGLYCWQHAKKRPALQVSPT